MVALPPDYRSSAQQMREASRGLLIRLRDERLAQRRGQAPRWVDAEPETQADTALSQGPKPISDDQPSMASAPLVETIIKAGNDITATAPSLDASETIKVSASLATETDSATWLEQFQRGAPLPKHETARDRISKAITDSCLDLGPAEIEVTAEYCMASPGESGSAKRPDTPLAATIIDADDQPIGEPLLHIESAPSAPDVQAANPAALTPAIPLEALSSIGPGVRWRLSQFGILSVQDLATTDIDALIGRLGEIGRLVNVRTWVLEAQHMLR
jgi:hypothetical protein